MQAMSKDNAWKVGKGGAMTGAVLGALAWTAIAIAASASAPVFIGAVALGALKGALSFGMVGGLIGAFMPDSPDVTVIQAPAPRSKIIVQTIEGTGQGQTQEQDADFQKRLEQSRQLQLQQGNAR